MRSNGSVGGMLLYANTEGENYMMDGSGISVKILDMNCRFDEVKKQMNGLAETWIEYIGSRNLWTK